MGKNRDLNPLDPLPANQWDALNELLSSYVSPTFELRIRAADPTVLEIPAGDGDDQVAAVIGHPTDATKARWRYIAATISRVGIAGVARDQDVWITASENVFAAGSPGEVDNTDYTFALAVVEAGAAAPAGPALKRKIGVATWDGAKFSAVAPSVGKGAAANTTQVVKIVGDGTIGPFDFVHGLQTFDYAVEVYETADPRGTVDVKVERPDLNTVRIRPDVAIAASGAVIVVTSRGRTAGAVAPHGSTHLPGVGSDPTQLPLIIPPAALPAGVDGQEVLYLADAAAGVVWHLRYRAADPSATKWLVIGGRPLTAESNAVASTTSSSFTDFSPSPAVVLPLAGDYDYDMTAVVNVTTVPNSGLIVLKFGTATEVSSDQMQFTQTGTSGNATTVSSGTRRKTGLAAGISATMRYAATGSSNVNFSSRKLAIRPVRVG